MNVQTTEKTRSADGTLTISEQNRRHQEWVDAQPLAVRCGIDGCGWSFEGSAAEGRQRAASHRLDEHPGLYNGSRRRAQQEAADRAAADRAAALSRVEARRTARAAEEEQVSALAAMDAGEPQPRQETGPAVPPRVGSTTSRSRPEAAAESGASGGASTPDAFVARNRRRKPYTRDELLAAFRRFHREHGRAPLPSDAKTCAYLPAGVARATRDVSGFASWQAVWDELRWGKVPQGQAARKHRGDEPVLPPRPQKAPAPAEPPAEAADDDAAPAAAAPATDEPSLRDAAVALVRAFRTLATAGLDLADALEREIDGDGPISIRVGGAA